MECRAENITKLQDILNEKELEHLVQKAKPGAKIVGYDFHPLTTDIGGLLGSYYRLTIQVQEDSVKNIHLFIKTLPFNNQLKVDTIRQNNFNTREALFYKLIEEMDDSEDDPNPWRPKAYIYNENMLVMSDLAKEGYKSHPSTKYFDKNHIMVTAKSVARFHATFANYATKKNKNRSKPYNFLEDYGHLMNDQIFVDPRWSQSAAKLTCKYLKEYSANYNKYPAHLEEQLSDLYYKAFDCKDYEDTLNVFVHRDLSSKNLLFRYSGDVAVNAILLDYQSMRIAPPAFDIMLVIHLTTSRRFRERYESEVLHHYYSVFLESLDDNTKQRLASLNYDIDTFLFWCEKARRFAMFYAASAFPILYMESAQANKTFDDPETLTDLLNNDRSKPVLEHAKENTNYRDKVLDIFEEIVEYTLQSCEAAKN